MSKKAEAYFFYGAWSVIGVCLCLRLLAFPIATSDYTYFVAQWFETLKAHPGLTAFRYPFSDYAPSYLYVLKFLTLIPVPSLYSIKAFTLLCDGAMAWVSSLIVRRAHPQWSGSRSLWCAAIVFSIPTVAVNSSLWGQSDVLYGGLVITSLYFILSDRPLYAALAFGGAFAMKLQSVFFFPILAGFLLRKYETAKYLLIPPIVYIVLIIPAWIGGGTPRDLLLVYFKESNEYTSLSVSAQSAFAFFTGPMRASEQSVLFWAGLLVAGVCAGAIAYLVYAMRESDREKLMSVALLCVLLIPYVLPRMHERYFYLADVCAVLYGLYYPKRFYVPLLVVCASLLAYVPYLSSQIAWLSGFHVDLRIPSGMMAAAIAIVSWHLFGRREAVASVGPPKFAA